MGIYNTDKWRWKLGTRLGSFISGNTHKLDLLFSAGETASTFSYYFRQPGPMKGIAKTPDHDIFYHLARVYATNHLSMLDQTQCKRWYFEVCSWHITVWELVLWGTLLINHSVGFSTLRYALDKSQCGMQYFEVRSWHITDCKDKMPEYLKQIFPEKEYRGLSPNFHIHVSVSEFYIPTKGLPFLLEEICGPILGIYKSLTDTCMWKLGLRTRNSQKRNV